MRTVSFAPPPAPGQQREILSAPATALWCLRSATPAPRHRRRGPSAAAQRQTLTAHRSVGRATISQVVEAETQLAERETDFRSARYQLVLAWQRLQAALGRRPSTDTLTRPIDSAN